MARASSPRLHAFLSESGDSSSRRPSPGRFGGRGGLCGKFRLCGSTGSHRTPDRGGRREGRPGAPGGRVFPDPGRRGHGGGQRGGAMTGGRRGAGRMAAAGWGIVLCLAGVCAAQETPRRPPPPPRAESPRVPLDVRNVPPPGLPAGAVGVSLLDALRLALLANLDIAQARAVVAQTLAARQRALVLWLPNLTAGSTYVFHDGRIQNTTGPVVDVNRDSLFVGGGPSVAVGLGDALFAPTIATRIVEAARAGEQRVTNDTLLAVAEAYFAVLRGVRRVRRADEVLYYLTSEREIPQTGGAKGLYPTIRDFVKVGDAPPPEQARVEVEVVRRREEAAFALQDLRFAMAELARLVRLDPRLLL